MLSQFTNIVKKTEYEWNSSDIEDEGNGIFQCHQRNLQWFQEEYFPR